MSFPDDQVRELVRLFPGVQQAGEGGLTYFLIPALQMPPERVPECTDALLCPMERDGYPSRLFFAQQITGGGPGTNWNANNVRILERNWFAVSWRVNPNLRLAQMIPAHLEAFR
jgi:hypothetical protein